MRAWRRCGACSTSAGSTRSSLSRSANKRYFSGFRLGHGEEATAGYSGTLLVTRDAQLILADSRYTEQATRRGPRLAARSDHPAAEPSSCRRCCCDHEIAALGMEAAVVSHADWAALAEAAPGVELHAIDDELVPLRLRKSPDEVDAIGRACALADACLAHLIGFIRPGMTEREVAWELESLLPRRAAPRTSPSSRSSSPAPAPPCPTAAHPRQRSSAATSCSRLRLHRRRLSVRHDAGRCSSATCPTMMRRYHDAVREAQAPPSTPWRSA